MKSQSIKYLKALIDRPEATHNEIAIALISLHKSKSINNLDALYSKVDCSNWSWLETSDPMDAAIILLCISQVEPEKISGECLANLAKLLIRSEISVGGPYNGKQSQIATNASIAQLFKALGHPLENVENYVATCQKSNLSPIEELLINWPFRLISESPETKINTDDPFITAVLGSSLSIKTSKADMSESAKNPVVSKAKKQIDSLPNPVKNFAAKIWQAVVNADKRQEISMLPALFADSVKLTSEFDRDKLSVDLGVANFYAWMAYSIYDDFIDNEGVPDLLPVANIMHRLSLFTYQELVSNRTDIQEMIKRVYNRVDQANSWELANTRAPVDDGVITISKIPNYKDGSILASRAYGHVLGPLILMNLDESISETQRDLVGKAFTHYLIARQLNDDAHDWVKDLAGGQINFVVAELLRICNVSPGTYDVDTLTKTLKEGFWDSGLEKICEITLGHASQSDMYFHDSKLLKPKPIILEHILYPIAETANASLKIHDNDKIFIKSYSS